MTSLPSDHTCCLDKSELETCLRFRVSENRNRNLRPESSLIFLLLLPSAQFDVVHQHFDLRHKQHTNSCRQHVLNLHVSGFSLSLLVGFFGFILTLGIYASKGSSSAPFSHFDICTRFTNWFAVITNGCYISNQSFRWTYERSALPSSVSRLLAVLRRTMISIVHIVGLCRFHFSIQVEIENVVFEILE